MASAIVDHVVVGGWKHVGVGEEFQTLFGWAHSSLQAVTYSGKTFLGPTQFTSSLVLLLSV